MGRRSAYSQIKVEVKWYLYARRQPVKGTGENKEDKTTLVHCNALQIVFFMPGHKKSRNAASNLTTGLHHEPHPIKCPNVDTSKIFGSSCPRCLVDDPYLDVPCRSKSGCGLTNDQAVDSPHNVLFYNAFPDHVLTNVSPNIVQQIVHPVHSSHAEVMPRP